MSEQNELVLTTLEYIQFVTQQVNTILKYLQENKQQEALTELAQLADNCGVLIEAFAVLYADGEEIDQMKGHTEALINGIENSDFILIADILEYELISSFEEWSAQLEG